jgi:hypothetical protein
MQASASASALRLSVGMEVLVCGRPAIVTGVVQRGAPGACRPNHDVRARLLCARTATQGSTTRSCTSCTAAVTAVRSRSSQSAHCAPALRAVTVLHRSLAPNSRIFALPGEAPAGSEPAALATADATAAVDATATAATASTSDSKQPPSAASVHAHVASAPTASDSKSAPGPPAAEAAPSPPVARGPRDGAHDRKEGASPPVQLTPPGLAALMGRTAERRMYQRLQDAAVTCDAKLPDSVMVENCQRVELTLLHKVANLKISGCENVTLRLPGVLSTIELINCDQCCVVCTRSCNTFAVDGSRGCRVHIPAQMDEAYVVVAQSQGTAVFAWREDQTVELSGEGSIACLVPDSEPAAPPNVPQTVVRWTGGQQQAFAAPRVRDRRDGHLGLQ